MLSWLLARNGPEKTAWYTQADRMAQVAALTASLADWHVEQQQGFQLPYLLNADSQLVKAGESSQLVLLKNVQICLTHTLSLTAHTPSQQQIAADGMSEAQCLHMAEQSMAEALGWASAAQAAAVLDHKSGGPGETIIAAKSLCLIQYQASQTPVRP